MIRKVKYFRYFGRKKKVEKEYSILMKNEYIFKENLKSISIIKIENIL